MDEFFPHRSSDVSERIRQLENWAVNVSARTPNRVAGAKSTAGMGMAGIVAVGGGGGGGLTAGQFVVLAPDSPTRNQIVSADSTVPNFWLTQSASGFTGVFTRYGSGVLNAAGAGWEFGLLDKNDASDVNGNALYWTDLKVNQRRLILDAAGQLRVQTIDGVNNAVNNNLFLQHLSNGAAPVAGFGNGIQIALSDSAGAGVNNAGFLNLVADSVTPGAVSTRWDIYNLQAGTGVLVLRLASDNSTLAQGKLSVNRGTTAPTAELHVGAGTAAAGTAPVKLTAGTFLSTPEAGTLEYDGFRPAFTPSIYRRGVSLSSDPVTATATVANTVTPTTVASMLLSGGDITAGMVFKARLIGRYSTANGADTVTVNAQVKGSTVLSVTTTAAAVTNAPFDLEFVWTCRTSGAGGTFMPHLKAEINGLVKTVTATGTTAINTTLENDVSFQVVWSNALAGNTFSAEQGFLEILN